MYEFAIFLYCNKGYVEQHGEIGVLTGSAGILSARIARSRQSELLWHARRSSRIETFFARVALTRRAGCSRSDYFLILIHIGL